MKKVLYIFFFFILTAFSGAVLHSQVYQPLGPGSATYSICASTSYYDNGGPAVNYTGNTGLSTVILYPSTTGNKVRVTYSSFDVEPGSGFSTCDYDWVKIYHGNGAGKVLIGTYCNDTGSPGTVTSTATDGSLTIEFYTDFGTTNAGWAATISCVCSAPASPTPATFGSSTWNVYCYNGSSLDLSGCTYAGYYVEAGAGAGSYDSQNKWSNLGTPSSAPGYSGCAVGVDGHTVVYKRQGFTCGKYQLDIPSHDDDIRVYVNGVQQFQHVGCCDVHTNIWTGYLSTSDFIEVRHAEGTGGSQQALTITNVTPSIVNGSFTVDGATANKSICTGSTVALAQGTGGSFPDATFCYWIGTENPAGSGWVTTWDIWNGANCNNMTPPNPPAFNTPGRFVVHTNAYNNTCGWGYYGAGVTRYVDVFAPPAISVQPNSPNICSGSTAALSITMASGTSPLTYQWQQMASNCATPTNVGTNSPNYTTPALTTGTYYYRCIVTNACNSVTSSCGVVTVSAPSVLGTISNAGPINFCNAADDWTTSGPVSISGHTGTIYWQWGSSNGGWNAWGSGTTIPPAYCCFQEKVSTSDGNADRMRWYVQSGACAATANSAIVYINNRFNAAPTTLTASASTICSGTGITLTANFASSINILGTVEFYSGSCGTGTLLYSITAGNNVTSVTTPSFNPGSTTTYYARYNPGTGTSCLPTGSCPNVTVTVLTAAPAIPVAAAASGITTTGFTANWGAAAGATAYYLDVSLNSSFSSFVVNNLNVGNVTSYGVTGLSCGTPYYYRVRGTNCVGTSANSGTITLTTSNCTILHQIGPNTTQSYTVCGASYYDDGGAGGNYTGNTGLATVRFFPATPGSKIQIAYTAFDVETHPTCGYDYVKIYDGNSNAAPLLGTWCNQTGSPGTITSSATDGSLTIEFYTDFGTVAAGWAANVSCCSPPGDQTTYGTNSWIGYVYRWSGSPGTPLATGSYVGYVTEPQVFNRNVGVGSVSGATTNLCGAPTDNFSVRYKMNMLFPAGDYIFTVVSDDGVRLSIDGGATWLTSINSWINQSATFTSPCISLSGLTSLVLEYYENTGSSQISFSYKPSPVAPSSITATPFNAIACPGNSTTLTANGSLAAYYPFLSDVNDASGNGLNLTGSGGTFTGGGIQLTTTSSYVSAATGILNTDQYTLDFYMQYTAAPDGSWRKIFGYEPAGTDRSPGIWKYPGAMQMHWRHDPGNTGLGEAKVYTQGQWYHVVGEKNGATLSVYVDGVLVESGAVANPKTPGIAPLYFGGAQVLLKEFKIYSGIFRWYTASCGGTLIGSSPTIVVAPATTTTYFLRTEGGCNSNCVSATINMDATPPTHDAVSVSNACWTCDNTNTYTITLQSTESGVDFGGPYGIMALINYQGANAGSYGGYFSWHPTTYVWTDNQVAATGGGFASKNAGYGASTITLVSASTSLSGNVRTVNFVVRPNATFPALAANDVSMYTSDGCNNQAGWTNWETNFNSIPIPVTPGAITGTASQCPNVSGQVYSIAAVPNTLTYNWTLPAGWIITSGAGTNAITVTTGAAGQNGNITVTAGNACGTSAAASLAVTVTAPSTPVAGPDQYICTGITSATMAASGTGTWSQVTGFACSTTLPNANPTITMTGLAAGKTYVFRWSAGSCSSGSYDDVVIVTQ